MNRKDIQFEPLTEDNMAKVRTIHREDISEDFVDRADTIMEITQYGIDYCCLGHTYAIKYKDVYIGVILLGEAIPVRPIALGCHKDNHKAEKFYLRHGFKKTDVMENNDYYYLRYPAIEM